MVVPLDNEELPRAHVKRIVKAKLAELARAYFNQDKDIPVQKEAFQAFAESTRIFIHYLSATANDICRESKRQTINAEDVLKALEDLEFKEFVEPLRISLEGFRKDNELKKSGSRKNGSANKRKAAAKDPDSSKNRGKARSSAVNTSAGRNTDENAAEEDDDNSMQ